MRNSAKIESVIVGIFDNAQDLERAGERLAAAGFEDTVYDEAIVAESRVTWFRSVQFRSVRSLRLAFRRRV
jgi:hypothetical protein